MDVSIMTWKEAHDEYKKINKQLKDIKPGSKMAKKLINRKQEVIFRIQYLKANSFNRTINQSKKGKVAPKGMMYYIIKVIK
ncbi:MAG: hypothetical protein RSD36_09625 [Terrisporobacter sp.]